MGFLPDQRIRNACFPSNSRGESDREKGEVAGLRPNYHWRGEIFLIEHEICGREAANIVEDKAANLIVDHVTNGFDETVKQRIRENFRLQNRRNPENSHKNMGVGKPPLDLWQKYHENGEYLQSVEITREALFADV